jgi:hypothetical protein
MSGNTCSSIEIYSPNTPIVSEKYDSVDCLLNGLQDNTNNLITAKNVRDAVFTIWERVDDLQSNVSNIVFSSPEPVPFTLGGIKEGSTFSESNMQSLWTNLLYPEPILTEPSVSFTSSVSGLYEIGLTVSVSLQSNFSRGLINPQYQSDSNFRSGLPISYVYSGQILQGTFNSTSLVDNRSINHSVLSGTNSCMLTVNYSAGIQPKTVTGDNFDSPLPQGSKISVVSIKGVYPFFATSVNITTLTKQTLSDYTDFIEFDLQPDSVSNKQRFEIPKVNADLITGLKQFNSFTNTWDWLGGNKSASLNILNTQFTKTNINKIINSYQVLYSRYVYNGPIIGFRKIRLYTN